MLPLPLIPLLLYFFTFVTVLIVPGLPHGPRLGMLASTTSILIGDINVFERFNDNSPDFLEFYERYGPHANPTLFTTPTTSPLRFLRAPVPHDNTTCLPRHLDPSLGMLDPAVSCIMGGVSIYTPNDGSYDFDSPVLHGSSGTGVDGLVLLAVFVVGLACYLRTVSVSLIYDARVFTDTL